MKHLVLVLCLSVLITALASADERPPGDYEDISYVCKCACYDWQQSAIRYRLPGGGYGVEYLHVPLYNRDWRLLTDHLVSSLGPAHCRSIRGAPCSGYRRHDDFEAGVRAVPGWLGGCRWDFNPLPRN